MHRLLLPIGLSAALLVGVLGACTNDDGPDPASAPRSNVPALSGDSLGSLSTETDPVPVPDVTVTTLDGASLALNEQDGKVLLLNFWATWCPPCIKEIPDLIALQEEMGADGLLVVGIALDQEGASVVQPFVENEGINYPIVADTEKRLESQLGPIYALPTTVVVGPDGMIRRRITGIFPTEAMRPELAKILADAPAPETPDADATETEATGT